MDIEGVVPADVIAKLANRFQERLAFDIANRAAHLDDDHVRA